VPTATTTASCASTVLASLSETQRIGQLFAVGLADDRFTAAERHAIQAHGFGSWWFTKQTSVGTAAIRKVADAIQAEATDDATGGIGSFVAANQEGGLIQALSGPGFDRIPSAVTQGTWSTTRLRDAATRWGRQLRKAGVNLDFAPVADVVPRKDARENAPIGQLEREYGFAPSVVADHVEAFIDGMNAAGVVTTAKHFPGLGRVVANTDFSSGVVDSVTTRDDPDLEPFRRAVDAGVPAVMMSLATYERIDPDRLAAFSWPIIGGILEDDLGFRGIVMSDSLSAEAVSSMAIGTRAVRFLDEGGDMIVVRPIDMAVEMTQAVEEHARESAWFRDRIDNAVLHVLREKASAGLLPCAD
jgi:beta-N-acetylhexosaminidase